MSGPLDSPGVREHGELVAQLTGVHYFELGAPLTLYLDSAQVYLFDAAGSLLVAPLQKRRGRR